MAIATRIVAPIAAPFDRMRDPAHGKRYSIRSEQVYVDWIRRFVRFHGNHHPAELGPADIERFLTSLAVERNVSASTQNQLRSAFLFLYRDAVGRQLRWLGDAIGAQERRPIRPTCEHTPYAVRSVGLRAACVERGTKP